MDTLIPTYTCIIAPYMHSGVEELTASDTLPVKAFAGKLDRILVYFQILVERMQRIYEAVIAINGSHFDESKV